MAEQELRVRLGENGLEEISVADVWEQIQDFDGRCGQGEWDIEGVNEEEGCFSLVVFGDDGEVYYRIENASMLFVQANILRKRSAQENGGVAWSFDLALRSSIGNWLMGGQEIM